MPVDRIISGSDTVWGLWKIQEEEKALEDNVPLDKIPAGLTNPLKRLEFFAGRALIKSLLCEWQTEYKGLRKDAYGKPFLADTSIHISLSHSYPYVAAILHRHKNVGIDLEQPKKKLLRIAARVLAENELTDAGEDVVKHCIYWCAKETLIKIYGKKHLAFAKNLLIDPFVRSQSGALVGRIVADNTETAIPLQYIVSDNFVVVVSS
jgi:4'-phosphopantetheinyl transferase